jgi:hypothetical protein
MFAGVHAFEMTPSSSRSLQVIVLAPELERAELRRIVAFVAKCIATALQPSVSPETTARDLAASWGFAREIAPLGKRLGR